MIKHSIKERVMALLTTYPNGMSIYGLRIEFSYSSEELIQAANKLVEDGFLERLKDGPKDYSRPFWRRTSKLMLPSRDPDGNY